VSNTKELTVDGLRRLVTKVLLNQQHLVLTAPFKLTNYLTAVTEHHGPEAEKEAIRYLAHIDSYLQGARQFMIRHLYSAHSFA